MHKKSHGFSDDGWGRVVVAGILATLVVRAAQGNKANGFRGPLLPRYIANISHGLWVAGIPSVEVERLAAPETWGRQRRQNWCWAAAVQMRLSLGGLRIRQEQVVQRIFGGDIDSGGTPQQILEALSGRTFTSNGKPALLNARLLRDWREMLRDLSCGNPLIAGLRNADDSLHAVVVTAVTYGRGWDGAPVYASIVTRDPWPHNQSYQELPWDEFASRATFVIRSSIVVPQGT